MYNMMIAFIHDIFTSTAARCFFVNSTQHFVIDFCLVRRNFNSLSFENGMISTTKVFVLLALKCPLLYCST